MSFGVSSSDISIIVTFCKALYRKCRTVGGEYDEISREVRELYAVLEDLDSEIDTPGSQLYRNASVWDRQLAPVIGDCDYTLRQLDGLLIKYGRLTTNNGGGNSPSSSKVLQAKLGSNEMDCLGDIRVKLISHKRKLNLCLDTVHSPQEKIVTPPNHHGEQLDDVLDKVDEIISKFRRHDVGSMINYEDDDKEVWKKFRKELIGEGVSSDVLEKHKDVLRAYIRESEAQGLPDKPHANSKLVAPVSHHTERWLESVQAPARTTSASARGSVGHNSYASPAGENGAKALMFQEENMKFPASMKLQRAMPESQMEGSQTHRQLTAPDVNDRRISGGSQRQVSLVPRLVTSSDEDKVRFCVNTDGSSESDSETDHSSRRRQRSTSPSYGQIITTASLIAMSQALTLHPHSPSSFKSQNSYFEEAVPRSIASRPNHQIEYGASPHSSGSIPIPIPHGKANERLGAAPRSNPIHLDPDSKGNIIPPEAKWTKINRRLVSPEVLDQAHKRYEARPDFVAVLGVLSRTEIQDLAARSHTLREARRKRHFPPNIPTPQPPRPLMRPHSRGSYNPKSDDETDSEDEGRRYQKKPIKGILKNNYKHQQYPQSPQSPAWSSQGLAPPPREREHERELEKGRERERDREPRKHRHHSSSSHHREKDGHRRDHRDSKDSKDGKEKERKKSMINGENLTFAGIGGAAVSLLHVLGEVAQGI